MHLSRVYYNNKLMTITAIVIIFIDKKCMVFENYTNITKIRLISFGVKHLCNAMEVTNFCWQIQYLPQAGRSIIHQNKFKISQQIWSWKWMPCHCLTLLQARNHEMKQSSSCAYQGIGLCCTFCSRYESFQNS